MKIFGANARSSIWIPSMLLIINLYYCFSASAWEPPSYKQAPIVEQGSIWSPSGGADSQWYQQPAIYLAGIIIFGGSIFAIVAAPTILRKFGSATKSGGDKKEDTLLASAIEGLDSPGYKPPSAGASDIYQEQRRRAEEKMRDKASSPKTQNQQPKISTPHSSDNRNEINAPKSSTRPPLDPDIKFPDKKRSGDEEQA